MTSKKDMIRAVQFGPKSGEYPIGCVVRIPYKGYFLNVGLDPGGVELVGTVAKQTGENCYESRGVFDPTAEGLKDGMKQIDKIVARK